MVDYPKINAHNRIASLFEAIRNKPPPNKITQDSLKKIFDLQSSSYHAMIPLLKRLEFIDGGNMPTSIYKSYKNNSEPKQVLGVQVKKSTKNFFHLMKSHMNYLLTN